MSSYVLSVRSKDKKADEFGVDVGVPTYLEVPDKDDVPKPSHTVGGVETWMKSIVNRANPPGAKQDDRLDIVFFVHGYNTPADEALLRQRLVEKELSKRGFACIVVGFDWPTKSGELGAALYAIDREMAQDTAACLVKGGIVPFTIFSAEVCPVNVHLMAHSMGGFVVREAFRNVDKARNSNLSNDWRIGQVVLFAADISSGCFELSNSDMDGVFNHCGRLTNYFSGYDKALAVSNAKNIDIDSRVGRVGMPVDTPAHEKAVDVDCGPRYAINPNPKFNFIDGMPSHSWYLEDSIWYDDLAYTLQGNIDRNLIPTRTRVTENDFVLNTK
jgi:hypothetical protein